ncbi:MAG: DUF4340 domain-containing protein [Clostridia bacterium]|nr:DUF4340 domain-containing protein [Clostridia bacterium]
MKQYKTAIIAILLIAIAVAAFLLVKNLQPEDSQVATPTAEDNSGYVFPFSTDKTTQNKIIAVDCLGTETLSLKKQKDTWICTTYPEIQVVNDTVTTLLGRFYSNNGAIVYEGAVTEEIKSDFGFDGQKKLVVTMEDGTSYTVLFGGLNTASTAQYVWLEGSETIYLYSKSFAEKVFLRKVDLISKTIFDFSDAGQIVRAVVWQGGTRKMELSASLSGDADANRVWMMSIPLERKGKNANIESWITKVVAIQIADIAELNCSDLSVYGLSPAAYSVSFTSPEKTITLHIGNKTKDGTQYYASIGDGTDVYLVGESVAAFKDADPLLYMDEVVYMVMYTELAHVRITMNGVTRTLSYEFDEDNQPTYIFEGHRTSDKYSDLGEGCSRLLTSLYYLEMTALELPGVPEIQGKVLCTVEYELRDGSTHTVVCAERDASTMYYYVDGQYIGGYGPQYYLTSSAEKYGIKGCIDALLELLHIS